MQREASRATRGSVVSLTDTRARILKAAKEIFFRDGFADTNLDEVASRAEVGKGTLYRHFESKIELYVAVLAAGGAAFDDAIRPVAEQEAPAIVRLREIGRFYNLYFNDLGKPPSNQAEFTEYLKRDAPKIAQALQENLYVIVPRVNPSGSVILAYEYEKDNRGFRFFVRGDGSVDKMTEEQLQAALQGR